MLGKSRSLTLVRSCVAVRSCAAIKLLQNQSRPSRFRENNHKRTMPCTSKKKKRTCFKEQRDLQESIQWTIVLWSSSTLQRAVANQMQSSTALIACGLYNRKLFKILRLGTHASLLLVPYLHAGNPWFLKISQNHMMELLRWNPLIGRYFMAWLEFNKIHCVGKHAAKNRCCRSSRKLGDRPETEKHTVQNLQMTSLWCSFPSELQNYRKLFKILRPRKNAVRSKILKIHGVSRFSLS